MRIGLIPSTQFGNPVAGGGTEAEYMQDVANRLVPLLRAAGFECQSFAGQSDANSDGARTCVAWGAHYALSIHSDAGGGASEHNGALCCFQENRSLPWCRGVMESYCKDMGMKLRGYQQRTFPHRVAVIRIPEAAGIPCCLIEVNWHDREPDASWERDPAWRQKCAAALCNAVIKYFGQAPQPKESEMGLDGSITPTKYAAMIANVDVDGECWVKVFNPSKKATKVHVGAVSTNKSKDLTVAPGTFLVVGAKAIGARGETPIVVTSDESIIVTFKQ